MTSTWLISLCIAAIIGSICWVSYTIGLARGFACGAQFSHKTEDEA